MDIPGWWWRWEWGALRSLPKRFDSLMPKAKLRQDTIRSLRYVGAAQGKSQCIYWDLALPGFGLRKFPNGRGSYVSGESIRSPGRDGLATLTGTRDLRSHGSAPHSLQNEAL